MMMDSKKMKVKQIRKRDGRIVKFDKGKIVKAVYKALMATGEGGRRNAYELAKKVEYEINKRFTVRNGDGKMKAEIPTVEEIQDIVESYLIRENYIDTAKAYIIYREQHRLLRESQKILKKSVDLVDDYLNEIDWQVKENSNMSYSLQGLNNYISNVITSKYWLEKIYPPEVREAYISGDLHIHDLGLLSVYCCGWDLKDLVTNGFGGVRGKIESSPPKHFRTALGQIVNFFYTLQGEAAGAQAFSNFDTLLAPFIRYDQLTYRDIKQAMQEFIFNMNVPTRVGFQCISEDTEILGKDGWKKYNQVKEGDEIATFNVEKGVIEYLPVKNVFAKKYKGKMYNLRNRISDQLISPEHRVVRRRFYAHGYVLERIEKILDLKSPFVVPVGSEGYVNGNDNTQEDVVKLIAWIVAEGSLDKGKRGSGRISIYQSKEKSKEDYEEIISISNNLGLKWTERTQKGLGAECNVIRFDANSTRKILQYFKSDKDKGIKFIPAIIKNADTETSMLFLETYIKGDGHNKCKITTTSRVIKDGLLQVAVNAGYGTTVLVRKPDNNLSKKDRYVIRIIKHKDTYINTVKEVNYKGIIWCPNTENETVVARRNGKVFITGNTPFTNLTMDLTVPSVMADEAVVAGGVMQKEQYKDFTNEMSLLNKAFAEVMLEGDASGRVFTFPIPTYNITKDFNWDDPNLEPIWEMTAKYGIPYFANYVNSDMSPEDARSMCCRLRLDNRELYKRGGGLFGAYPLTGSVGVVTINMPRIGYLAKSKKDFYGRLGKAMDIAKESLEIKRKTLEDFTEKGLYPYSKHFLSNMKLQRGEYWGNHFSTIGIIGMNEALLNFFGSKTSIGTKKGNSFAQEVLSFMRDRMVKYQEETGNLYNLEATPGEGTAYRLAKKDVEKYPDIITALVEA
jgi:ribonucleoside-triphosphate reductase